MWHVSPLSRQNRRLEDTRAYGRTCHFDFAPRLFRGLARVVALTLARIRLKRRSRENVHTAPMWGVVAGAVPCPLREPTLFLIYAARIYAARLAGPGPAPGAHRLWRAIRWR